MKSTSWMSALNRSLVPARTHGFSSPQRSHFREIAVSDGEWLGALLHRDRSDAEHAAKLVLGDLHRAGRGRTAWRRLRKGGGAGGVERYCAFYLLHDLVNVAVEHRY